MAKYHFYTPKSICSQIMSPCLCPPRAIHGTTLALIKFRFNLLFSVKEKTRKTLFSCYFFLAPLLHIRQEYSFLSVQGITFLHLKREERKKEGRLAACLLARSLPHLQVPLASCWAESILNVSHESETLGWLVASVPPCFTK